MIGILGPTLGFAARSARLTLPVHVGSWKRTKHLWLVTATALTLCLVSSTRDGYAANIKQATYQASQTVTAQLIHRAKTKSIFHAI